MELLLGRERQFDSAGTAKIRSLVKRDHTSSTPRCRGFESLTNDERRSHGDSGNISPSYRDDAGSSPAVSSGDDPTRRPDRTRGTSIVKSVKTGSEAF